MRPYGRDTILLLKRAVSLGGAPALGWRLTVPRQPQNNRVRATGCAQAQHGQTSSSCPLAASRGKGQGRAVERARPPGPARPRDAEEVGTEPGSSGDDSDLGGRDRGLARGLGALAAVGWPAARAPDGEQSEAGHEPHGRSHTPLHPSLRCLSSDHTAGPAEGGRRGQA